MRQHRHHRHHGERINGTFIWIVGGILAGGVVVLLVYGLFEILDNVR